MVDDKYVVVLDRFLDFCRLFRSDSENIPSGEILWSGLGLRRGYDAMIRLNKERKPIVIYFVCSKQTKKKITYKLFKSQPDNNYVVVSTHPEYKIARAKMLELTHLREAQIEKERQFSFLVMDHVGINSKRIPKWTSSDLKYITWLQETGKIAA